MATYSNQHWLLSHIRNSFISTDDTGMCETVMISTDLPKNYLRKYQTHATPTTPVTQQQQLLQQQQQMPPPQQQQRKSMGNASRTRVLDPPLQEVDFICYPGLDQSDDEDMDLSTQSFDIQMYPEVGAHRFRSNTAQKLEKMDIARRKAARTKCVNFYDEIVPPERSDFFVRKPVGVAAPVTATISPEKRPTESEPTDAVVENELEKSVETVIQSKIEQAVEPEDVAGGIACGIKSKLALQLANSPKQAQNKFMEYARFDGTSLSGIQTKRIYVYLSMLPERERNYPIKICVLASAKIIEVIGLVCYKATIQYPDIPLKSIRHYALYMTEDNDDMEDFPPLDNREPCSKFGFSHLTLAERRPLAPVTRIDYHNNFPTKSMTSEEEKARLAAAAVHSIQGIEFNGSGSAFASHDEAAQSGGAASTGGGDTPLSDYDERMLSHNDMLEAPLYRTYRLNIIDKLFFKTEVTLGISGERIEIDQHKNVKFWTKQKAVTYPTDAIACCEIVDRRQTKSVLRIWLKAASSVTTSGFGAAGSGSSSGVIDVKSSSLTLGVGGAGISSSAAGTSAGAAHSPTSPSHYPHLTSPFAFLAAHHLHSHHAPQMRFKHYDFEVATPTAEHIRNKLNYILEVRSSEVRREFMALRERKMEKSQAKKTTHLKM